MKKIGEGYYYNVFELDSNRVIKKVKNKLRIFLFMLFANKGSVLKTKKQYQTVINSFSKFRELYQKITLLIQDKSIIGNPTFVNDREYTQDKVVLLDKVNQLSQEDFVQTITDYTNLIKRLWSFGVHELVFNFSNNYGYNQNKQLVLVDFNEVSFDKESVREQIQNKVWLKRFSYSKLTKDKQGIFEEIMSKEVTEESLDSFWPK